MTKEKIFSESDKDAEGEMFRVLESLKKLCIKLKNSIQLKTFNTEWN